MIVNISLNKEEKGMVLSSKDPVLEVKGGAGVLNTINKQFSALIETLT